MHSAAKARKEQLQEKGADVLFLLKNVQLGLEREHCRKGAGLADLPESLLDAQPHPHGGSV